MPIWTSAINSEHHDFGGRRHSVRRFRTKAAAEVHAPAGCVGPFIAFDYSVGVKTTHTKVQRAKIEMIWFKVWSPPTRNDLTQHEIAVHFNVFGGEVAEYFWKGHSEPIAKGVARDDLTRDATHAVRTGEIEPFLLSVAVHLPEMLPVVRQISEYAPDVQ